MSYLLWAEAMVLGLATVMLSTTIEVLVIHDLWFSHAVLWSDSLQHPAHTTSHVHSTVWCAQNWLYACRYIYRLLGNGQRTVKCYTHRVLSLAPVYT